MVDQGEKGGTIVDLTDIVDELQSLVASGSKVPGFKKKVMVDIERIESIANELRNSLPAHMQDAGLELQVVLLDTAQDHVPRAERVQDALLERFALGHGYFFSSTWASRRFSPASSGLSSIARRNARAAPSRSPLFRRAIPRLR